MEGIIPTNLDGDCLDLNDDTRDDVGNTHTATASKRGTTGGDTRKWVTAEFGCSFLDDILDGIASNLPAAVVVVLLDNIDITNSFAYGGGNGGNTSNIVRRGVTGVDRGSRGRDGEGEGSEDSTETHFEVRGLVVKECKVPKLRCGGIERIDN